MTENLKNKPLNRAQEHSFKQHISFLTELKPATTFAWLFILGEHNINQGQVK